MCLSKRRWGRLARAQRALEGRRKVGLGGSVYRCPLCGGWHITSRGSDGPDWVEDDADDPKLADWDVS
jgi:hypothetical protein